MAVIVSVILILLGISVLVFIHVCVVGRALRRGFENEIVARTSGGNGDAETSRSMRRDELEKLPWFEYVGMEEEGKGSPVDCAVCLGKFEVGEKCRMLPVCRHSFHAECVDEWLLVAPVCPICRTSTSVESFKGCGGDEEGDISVIPASN